jgi:hypothetical protein
MAANVISIEVATGGFVLTYPVTKTQPNGSELEMLEREVFISPRKLNQKLKDVIASLSLVPEEK